MHFGIFLHASFIKKVLGAYFQFLVPKRKLFAGEFRRISEDFALQGL